MDLSVEAIINLKALAGISALLFCEGKTSSFTQRPSPGPRLAAYRRVLCVAFSAFLRATFWQTFVQSSERKDDEKRRRARTDIQDDILILRARN